MATEFQKRCPLNLAILIAGREEHWTVSEMTKAERGLSTRGTCGGAECMQESSCRIFLCACCRCSVLIGRRCDRGQIYCVGACAQEARQEKQREARRRYQATPRGRALHAERSRRYRTRQRVTDHGLGKQSETRPPLGLVVDADLSELSSRRKPSGHARCHRCGCRASAFLRQSAVRSGYRRTARKARVNGRSARLRGPP
jgi:hypothetical protein